MADSLLNGFRALDLTDEKGFVCGKILAALGIDTIKIEKPGGDPSRNIPPFLNNIEHPENSLYWQAFNTDKRSITLDLTQHQGQEVFRNLVARSDFVLESFTPGYMDSIGLGYAELSRINPGIIMTSITPFGQKGPYSHFKGSELIVSAMSGVLLTSGDSDRPPVKDGTDLITFHSNIAAALGTIIAHYYREMTGDGQQIDVSMQEVATNRTSINMVMWQFENQLRGRSGSIRREGASNTIWIWPCKDGYLFWSFFGGKMGAPANSAMSQWIDDDGLANPLAEVKNWDEFDLGRLSVEILITYQAAVRKLFLNHTKDEIAYEGLKRGINACIINTPADVLKIEQLKVRDYWVNLAITEHELKLNHPKYFFLADQTENFVRNRAPHIGEHNSDIFLDIPKWPLKSTKSVNEMLLTANNSLEQQALDGIKVLDFGWAVAGSLVSKYLADHGAQVIRIESNKRLDATRTSQTVRNSINNNPDDKPRFTYYNTSKLSLSLNLKRPQSRYIINKLISWADVVNENFTPGTLSKLGLDYNYMKTIRPDIIMVSGSVYGQTGTLSQEWGVDGTGAALSGYLALTGWPDRMPASPNGHTGDVVLPLMNAMAVVAALDYRRRTGKGQYIDGSMLDTCIHQITPSLLDLQANGHIQIRNGNRIAYASPHGVFPCLGNDQWCAIAVFSDEEWKAFCDVTGNYVLSNELKYATLKSRKENEDELEKLVSSWTVHHTAGEVMQKMQAAGVAAGTVQTMQDIIDRDPQLKERGFLIPLKHPVIGSFGHPTPPFKLSKTRAQVRTSPCLGEHNEFVCTKLLGITDKEFVELLQQGIFE